MNRYTVIILETAQEDLRKLSELISYEYKSPLTSKRYLKGLYDEIRKLSRSAESFQLQTRPYFRKYGMFVYRINYKKMAIIYTIHGDKVFIQEVIPSVSITGL